MYRQSTSFTGSIRSILKPFQVKDHQCVEPAGAVVVEDRGADRGGIEEHRGQADREQEPPDSVTTVGADQQDVGRRVPEQPVADAEMMVSAS